MTDDDKVDAFLEHHGIPGMKWGQRKAERGGVSRKTDREAHKDAKEFARAKMFYGQGAGIRRKLIKGTVEAKSKRDPHYARAFNKHLANQDMSTHASRARGERSRKDKRDTITKSAGAIARSRTGEMGTKAAFTVAAVSTVAYVRSPQGQRTISKGASRVKTILNSPAARKRVKNIQDIINRSA